MTEDQQEETLSQKIDRVRPMPFKTEEEKSEKHDEALSIQIETMSSYAQIAYSAEQIMIQNPNVNIQDFEQLFNEQRQNIPHPELAQEFFMKCFTESVFTENALNKIKAFSGVTLKDKRKPPDEWEPEERQQMGSYLFERITNEKPTGTVSLEGSMFGIILSTEKQDDLKKLEKDDHNIGGFYRNREQISTESYSANFPLIAVLDGPGKNGTLVHELGHALNNALITTVSGASETAIAENGSPLEVKSQMDEGSGNLTTLDPNRKHIVFEYGPKSEWLRYWYVPENPQEKPVTGYIKKEGIKIRKTGTQAVWGKGEEPINEENLSIGSEDELKEFLQKKYKNQLISLAKNELIADFEKRGDFSHFSNLIVRGGVYDTTGKYFEELRKKGKLNLSEEVSKEVIDSFWKEYTQELEGYVREAVTMGDAYQRFGLNSRQERLPYILGMVPLPALKDQPGRSYLGGFKREVQLLNDVARKLQEKKFQYANDLKYVSVDQKFLKVGQYNTEHPNESLIPLLKECLSEIEAVGAPKEAV